jgi:methylthioribose-1-phosphate isomerase
MKPFEWTGEKLSILDQRLLPGEIRYIGCRASGEVAEAIRGMAVRGAPAIGIAAAYGAVLAAKESNSVEEFKEKVAMLRSARPTAVNLMWAVDRMLRLLRNDLSLVQWLPEDALSRLEEEAKKIEAEDFESCRRIGAFGNALIMDGDGILTHCNAGALATAGYGTALGVIRSAHEAGKRIQVYADETRPYLQGARLTATELHADGIPVTLLCDDMAAWLMRSGKVQKVVVGADRIAANGDTANKIGTYQVALCAKAHGIPFYVAAPFSTVDLALPDGGGIPIEQRDENEVLHAMGVRTAPTGVSAYNPAFDVTPSELIAAIVTDRGVAFPPLAANLELLCKSI